MGALRPGDGMKKFLTGVVLLSLMICANAGAEEKLSFGEVSVEPGVSQVLLFRPGRDVKIIDGRDLENTPGTSVADILEYAAGVDVRRRGPDGAQADVHMRGSGFNQVEILLDGVRMNDSQTGHHNMDLPVSKDDIERIELLAGDGSAFFGPGAAGGVINIVTKRRGEKKAALDVAAGKYGYSKVGVNVSGKSAGFSFSRKASDGYRDLTSLANTSVFADATLKGSAGTLRISGGRLDNRFGAHSYYVPGWPSKEKTKTAFVNAAAVVMKDVSISMYHREHGDMFQCNAWNIAICRNVHHTERNGADVKKNFSSKSGASRYEVGVGFERDSISSSNIGNHSLRHASLYARSDSQVSERLTFSVAARDDAYTEYDSLPDFSAGLNYRAGKRTGLRFSLGSAHRIPDFTELYYNDPAHTALGGLLPEKFLSAEAGVDLSLDAADVSLTAYTRKVKKLIDWAGPSAAGPWLIGNQGDARFSGATFEVSAPLAKSLRADLSYDLLKMDWSGAGYLKYSLAHPKHAARLALKWALPGGVNATAIGTYEKMDWRKSVSLMDAMVSKEKAGVRYYIEARNIFDRKYEDVPGDRMPGLAVYAGASAGVSY